MVCYAALPGKPLNPEQPETWAASWGYMLAAPVSANALKPEKPRMLPLSTAAELNPEKPLAELKPRTPLAMQEASRRMMAS